MHVRFSNSFDKFYDAVKCATRSFRPLRSVTGGSLDAIFQTFHPPFDVQFCQQLPEARRATGTLRDSIKSAMQMHRRRFATKTPLWGVG